MSPTVTTENFVQMAAVRFNDVPSEDLNAALSSYVDALDGEVFRGYVVARLAEDIRSIRRAEALRAELAAERAARRTEQRPPVEASPSSTADAAPEAQERAAAVSGLMERLLQETTDALRIEWTADLLATEFSPYHDGTRTTWGEATAEDHQSRIDLLMHNVTTNVDLIARHRKALETLEAKGAACLLEVA